MKRIFHEIVRFERKVPCNILIIILAILPLVYVYFHANSTANLRLPNIFELRNLKSLVPYDMSYVEEQEDIEVYQDEYNEDSDYYEELVEEETLNHEEDGEIEEVKENSVYDGDKLDNEDEDEDYGDHEDKEDEAERVNSEEHEGSISTNQNKSNDLVSTVPSVLILTQARSGSSFLGSLMSADTKSYYLFEPFNMNLKGARLGDLLDKEEQEL